MRLTGMTWSSNTKSGILTRNSSSTQSGSSAIATSGPPTITRGGGPWRPWASAAEALPGLMSLTTVTRQRDGGAKDGF